MKIWQLAVAALVVAVTAAWPLLMHMFAWWSAHRQHVDLGQTGVLGDSYGLLTSVFSGATLLLLLFTIGKQLEAVQAQKESVRLQKKLFKRQLAHEAERSRHERTMWLVETYNSPEMRTARSRASTLVKSLTGAVKTLTELESEQVEIRASVAAGNGLTPGQALRLDEIRSLFTVLFFYDTWAKLKEHQSIENELALDFFAPAVVFYTENYCLPVLEQNDPTWQDMLRRIVDEVGSPSVQRRTGRASG